MADDERRPAVRMNKRLKGLRKYWHGQMGDLQKGSFTKAVKVFKRHGDKIDDPEALAAWWHLKMTGMTPMQKHKLKGYPIKRRKKGGSPPGDD